MSIQFTFFPLVQGQTAYDVADTEIFRLLEELKKKQATAQKDRGDINSILQKKGASTPKRRSVLILPKCYCKLKMSVYLVLLVKYCCKKSVVEGRNFSTTSPVFISCFLTFVLMLTSASSLGSLSVIRVVSCTCVWHLHFIV
jgi:hypothetical protein